MALVEPQAVTHWLLRFFHKELLKHPDDMVARWIHEFALSYSVDAKTFAVLYLASHGIIKLGLVIGLLRNAAWAYPASIVAFGGFIVYQLYRFTFTHSMFLIVLTVFDLIVLWLVWHEWQQRRRAAAAA